VQCLNLSSFVFRSVVFTLCHPCCPSGDQQLLVGSVPTLKWRHCGNSSWGKYRPQRMELGWMDKPLSYVKLTEELLNWGTSSC
jgi:hypothetical protein